MRKKRREKRKWNGLQLVAGMIIGIGLFFVLLPHLLRVFYYHNSARLAEQLEDAMGSTPVSYIEIDYSKLKTAQPIVYTAEEIDAAQQNTNLLDDLTDIDDNTTVIDSGSPAVDVGGVKEDTYLLDIPAIDLKICAIRCSSFECLCFIGKAERHIRMS